MSVATGKLVIPRPGASTPLQAPITGPSEDAFTETFGRLLPPAKFVTTAQGKAAYYKFPPSTASSDEGDDSTPRRVVLIHGVQTPALGMFPLSRVLRDSFPNATVVILELWGHGLSDALVTPHVPELFHDLLDQLLDKLHWSSAHLVGYSFGAVCAAGYTIFQPGRVQSLTLVAPAGFIDSSKFSPEEQEHLKQDCDEEAAAKWVFNFLEGGDLIVPADWKERVAKGEVVAEAIKDWEMREHPGHPATVVAVLRDGGAMDFHKEYLKTSSLDVPTFVVLGELDGLNNATEVKEHGFQHVAVVPAAGHAVVRDRAPEVGAFIRDFWVELSSKKSSS